jgi:GlpG protein
MPYGVGPLTLILVGLSLVVQVLVVGGFEERVLRELYMTAVERDGVYYRAARGLPEILSGEVWRLFTPILVHGGWVHLLFNMMCLLGLGSMIEGRESTGKLGLLVIVLAAGSNLGQYVIAGPIFCGMSGVVYGLLGYVWTRGKFDPASGFLLHPHTVAMMLFWFFLCLASVVPGIGEGITAMVGMVANGCHAVGLAMGVAWGFLASVPAIRRGA